LKPKNLTSWWGWQLQGYDTLRAGAEDVVKETVDVFAIMVKSLDFKMAALDTLSTVFATRQQYTVSSFQRFDIKLGQYIIQQCASPFPPAQLIRTPQTILAAMDLLVTFVKLHLLWCQVEERKTIIALFMLANHLKNDVRNNTSYER